MDPLKHYLQTYPYALGAIVQFSIFEQDSMYKAYQNFHKIHKKRTLDEEKKS